MSLKNSWKTIVVIGIPVLLLPLIICFQNDVVITNRFFEMLNFH